jgi:hypothetical protein
MEQPPNCQECGKPLREYAYGVSHTDGRYGWAGCGYFCTKDCAAYWAVSRARKQERNNKEGE